MKTKIIMMICVLSMLLSTCSSKQKTTDGGKELLNQKLFFPDGTSFHLIITLTPITWNSNKDSVYRISLKTDDKKTHICFDEEQNTTIGGKDTIIKKGNDISTFYQVDWTVSDGNKKYGDAPLKCHATVTISAYKDLCFDETPIAKLEFVPDLGRSPKIKEIRFWIPETFLGGH